MGIKNRREREEKNNMKDLANEFYEELVLTGTKKRNIPGIRYKLKKLLHYLEENQIEINRLGIKEAQDYQGWIIETGTGEGNKYTPGSVRNFMKIAKRFYEFLKKKGIVATNPFMEITLIRSEKKLPENILKEKEMNKLLKALSEFSDEGAGGLRKVVRRYRVHVICEIMYSTGLRINEAALLRIEDVDLEKRIIHLKEGKGDEPRVVFLNEYAAGIFSYYINEMYPLLKKLYYHNTSLLFGAGGNWLDTIINEELKEICLKLGLRKATCHSFRHAFGFHLLRAGCDIRYIQELLGHKKIVNTEIYTKVERDDLREKIDHYHPRQFKKVRDEKTE